MGEEKEIRVSGLEFAYPGEEPGMPGHIVLKGLDLQIPRGQFVAVLGHNGSGKSTLAKHFNAILLPTSGDVVVCGINTKDEERLFDIRQQVGMVFQNRDNQIVAAIVEEDVAFALENLGVEPSEIRRRVDEALKEVDMYQYREHAPHQLSGGQKQRVAIAGILAMRPDFIVLDEPTAMLDPRGRSEVLRTIRELNRDYHTTVVLITHYMDEAVQAERVVVVDSGKILRDGTPREVFTEVELLKSVGLDVPQVTESVDELRQAGSDQPQDILTENECYQALKELLTASANKR